MLASHLHRDNENACENRKFESEDLSKNAQTCSNVGVIAMDHLFSLKAVTNALPHSQHYLA